MARVFKKILFNFFCKKILYNLKIINVFTIDKEFNGYKIDMILKKI